MFIGSWVSGEWRVACGKKLLTPLSRPAERGKVKLRLDFLTPGCADFVSLPGATVMSALWGLSDGGIGEWKMEDGKWKNFPARLFMQGR
jgi:hypothetical protein